MVNAFQCNASDSVRKLVITRWIPYDLRCFPNVSVSSEFRIRHHFEADMGKLSVYARNRILSLRSSGVKIQKIKDMLEEEGIETNVSDAPRRGRKPILNEEQLQYVDEQMKENDELTSSELKNKLGTHTIDSSSLKIH